MLSMKHIQASDFIHPKEDLQRIALMIKQNLSDIIAIDSQSNDKSRTIPSTEGQKTLCAFLKNFFDKLNLTTYIDEFSCLMVENPSNRADQSESPIARITHLDTSEGTKAVSNLYEIRNWDGSKINYPENSHLNVTVQNYPDLKVFLGHDILHGPGSAPVGFDDKIGIALLMTEAQLLKNNPQIPYRGRIDVFRPDEEINREEGLATLAENLYKRGVRRGYTIDGIKPFEINIENFHASSAKVLFSGSEITLRSEHDRILTFNLFGAKSHGCSAKSEGYLNSTVIFAKAFDLLTAYQGIVPLDFQSASLSEVEAEVSILVSGETVREVDSNKERLLSAFNASIKDHVWKGVRVELKSEVGANQRDRKLNDAARSLYLHLSDFLRDSTVKPLLSEESEGFEGYSNPNSVQRNDDGTLTLSYRLRDFSRKDLTTRELEIAALCANGKARCSAPKIEQEYKNMGEQLKQYPELVEWAKAALVPLGEIREVSPIRGGTGVDPFLKKGIALANLGTGYWAPESEKEITSLQFLAKHVLWLCYLSQTR